MPNPSAPTCPVGRWAPSPTGPLHLGNARTALATWLSVRHAGGRLLWRLEDLDGPRVVAGLAEKAQLELAWLGLDWDEGPDLGGNNGPYRQSQRSAHYERALRRLLEGGRLFPCSRSRKELEEIASAPHGRARAYPRHLRPSSLVPGWFEAFSAGQTSQTAIRFAVRDGNIGFDDLVYGYQSEDVAATVGDFVLKRRDGLYAYQLTVVVDDIAMGVTEVVRGYDLLDSTPRQIQLIEALGATPPRYAHVPLVVNQHGEKLSKRDHALSLTAVAAAGLKPQQITGYLAYSLGLLDKPRRCRPLELVENFSWKHINRQPWKLAADVVEQMAAIA